MFGTTFGDVEWVGGSEKIQKCADVVYGWSLTFFSNYCDSVVMVVGFQIKKFSVLKCIKTNKYLVQKLINSSSFFIYRPGIIVVKSNLFVHFRYFRPDT